MRRYRVGIVGVGEAAQILHLPTLYQLEEQFEVTALCDVSRAVLDSVGDRWGIATRLLDHRQLVARDDVDIVLVSNPSSYHFEVTMAAIGAGKHVLVEKPMCYAPAEADEIARAADAAGVTVQVGYMRRYSPSFLEACRVVGEMGDVRLARVHDVIGSNAQIIEPTSRVARGDDIPDDAKRAATEHDADATARAIGDVAPELSTAYHIMLGLSSHDLSAMREIIGVPKDVLYAAVRHGGRYISAAFDYGDFVCHFETGIDDIPRFDAHIEVYGAEKVVRVDYDTPYVRNLPTRLAVTHTRGRHGLSTMQQHDWGDSFTEEWRSLAATISADIPPKASPADFRSDLELFGRMIQRLKASVGG